MKSKFVSVVVCLAFLAMLAVPATLAPIASATSASPVWSVGDNWVYNASYNSGTGVINTGELNCTVTDTTGDNYTLLGDYDPDAIRVEPTTGAWFTVPIADLSVIKSNMQYQQAYSTTIVVYGSIPDKGYIDYDYGSAPPIWPLNVGETWDFTKHYWDTDGVVNYTRNREAKVLAVEDVSVPAGTLSCLHIVEYDPANPGFYTYEHWLNEDLGCNVKIIDRETFKGAETWVLKSYNYVPPVSTITSMEPDRKTAGAGDFTLTVNGRNFVDGLSVVRWNGSDRTTTYVSATQLTAAIPASDIATAGTASVTVFNTTPGGGESNLATLTINPAPNITSVSPDNGPIGTEVTVSGLNFDSVEGSSYVSFGDLQATEYTSWSDTEVKCKVPEGVSGEVQVTLTVDDRTSNSLTFTEWKYTPTGTDVQVDLGQGSGMTFEDVESPGGTTFTSQSDPEVANFAVQDGSSYDLSTTATFTGKILISLAYDENELTVEEESLKLLHYEGGNWVDVTKGVDTVNNIITGEVTSLSPLVTAWTSSLPRPSVGAAKPAQGLAGSEVTITGTAFGSSQGKSFVKFGTEHATVTSWKDTEIRCRVPSGIEGPVQLKVSTPGGTSEGTGFKVIPLPTVTSITPSSAGNGSGDKRASLTISGANFVSGAKVKLTMSGKPARKATSVIVSTSQAITCKFNLSSALPGAWNVVVTNPDGGTGTLTGGLTVNPHPTVTSISPKSACFGNNRASVDISGDSFVSGAEVKLTRRGKSDRIATIVNVPSSKVITCRFDLTNAPLGSWKVVVINPDHGSGTMRGSFKVNPLPTVTSITPNSANRVSACTVKLQGTKFVTSATVRLSKFGQMDIIATSVTRSSSAVITCQFNLTGAATGAWNVVVINPDGGVGKLADGFTVN